MGRATGAGIDRGVARPRLGSENAAYHATFSYSSIAHSSTSASNHPPSSLRAPEVSSSLKHRSRVTQHRGERLVRFPQRNDERADLGAKELARIARMPYVIAGVEHDLPNLRRPVSREIVSGHQREVFRFDHAESLITSRRSRYGRRDVRILIHLRGSLLLYTHSRLPKKSRHGSCVAARGLSAIISRACLSSKTFTAVPGNARA